MRFWLDATADAFPVYDRIIGAPERAWMHGEDEHGFLVSRWHRPVSDPGAVFLVPSVRQAEVTCYSYASPRQQRDA
jgi:hypothetical protein